MRLATYDYKGLTGVGVVVGERIVDVTPLGPTMLDLITADAGTTARLQDAVAAGSGGYDLADVTLLAPIPVPPRNVLCVGRNYAEHIAEGASHGRNDGRMPEHPAWFTKAVTSLCGPADGIGLDLSLTGKHDWEAELAVVIGRPGRHIPKERAMEHIHSYCVLNDVTARDIQHRYGDQWFKGKSIDASSPMGPWLVTADEVGDPGGRRITCSVNGVLKQDSDTSQFIFDIPTLIADISQVLTLQPGDIISTGTPGGVGNGRTPQEYLRPGDVLETHVAGIGRLRNACVAL
ncbi:fumarylacetoacetate hydrolase family protein [Actinacidiphila epipremni]|jgi:2-keto-4-pentenoate hydratase/2-oxohepta-3-ene-1,7-dioic acid hydratase in catechol pathway|uniref:Fumarylacetoacetate hydrolase family protein n=1 Tax=Actinacidiphila epipremni TaxID=2053013 RepID=A0ABX0ZVW3_9ACTN|nr:fumarylacetoacetate hydrolase family protein [Actinacidiphila epipremni]NJP46812.1 fumarylacetoacetate hydrolase family protein [Actinacidiphila epipremni]